MSAESKGEGVSIYHVLLMLGTITSEDGEKDEPQESRQKKETMPSQQEDTI